MLNYFFVGAIHLLARRKKDTPLNNLLFKGGGFCEAKDGGLQNLCFFILYQSSVSLNARQLLSKGAFDKQIHVNSPR